MQNLSTQEKIEAIRKECIRVNPEITELKFGCRVQLKQTGDRGYILAQEFNSNLYYNESIKEVRVRDFESDEIIGRKLGLADVLLAIYRNDEERSDSKSLNGLLTVEINGDFFLMEQNLSKKVSHWNLLKSLEDQEETVISFIHNVLKI